MGKVIAEKYVPFFDEQGLPFELLTDSLKLCEASECKDHLKSDGIPATVVTLSTGFAVARIPTFSQVQDWLSTERKMILRITQVSTLAVAECYVKGQMILQSHCKSIDEAQDKLVAFAVDYFRIHV